MGSFYMNCSVTRHPFCYEQKEAVLIPIFLRERNSKPVYMYDDCHILPLFVNCEYYDYGQFKIEESPMSNRVLALLKSAITQSSYHGRRQNVEDDDDDDDEIDLENFTWDTFFELSHADKSCSYGRITYAAIHKSVFERIISDYTMYGQLDTSIKEYEPSNYGNYGFDHYLNEKRNSILRKQAEADIFIKDLDARIQSLTEKELAEHLASGGVESSFKVSDDINFLEYRKRDKARELLEDRDYGREPFIKLTSLLPDEPTLGDEEFVNGQKIRFLNCFLSCISMPWAESVYSGQECDIDGYKVLRNCYAELTVQGTIDHFETDGAEEGEEVIDKNDKTLIDLMDKLNHIDV